MASARLRRASAYNAAMGLGAGARRLPVAETSLSAAKASAPGAMIFGAGARRRLQRRRRCLLQSAARGVGAAAASVGVRARGLSAAGTSLLPASFGARRDPSARGLAYDPSSGDVAVCGRSARGLGAAAPSVGVRRGTSARAASDRVSAGASADNSLAQQPEAGAAAARACSATAGTRSFAFARRPSAVCPRRLGKLGGRRRSAPHAREALVVLPGVVVRRREELGVDAHAAVRPNEVVQRRLGADGLGGRCPSQQQRASSLCSAPSPRRRRRPRRCPPAPRCPAGSWRRRPEPF